MIKCEGDAIEGEGTDWIPTGPGVTGYLRSKESTRGGGEKTETFACNAKPISEGDVANSGGIPRCKPLKRATSQRIFISKCPKRGVSAE